MSSLVTGIAPASPQLALRHFEARLGFETDCWDVHESMKSPTTDFVLVDVRSPAMFATSHVPGAINIPHAKMTEGYLASYPKSTVFVVYCAGPHCNGANKAAVRLARLGDPVKEMIGGMAGWADERFEFEAADRMQAL